MSIELCSVNSGPPAKMARTKVVRFLITSVLVFMFFFQVQISVQKLYANDTIDSTYGINISDISLPFITICPRDQYNKSRVEGSMYEMPLLFVVGIPNRYPFWWEYLVSWGQYHNLTFSQMLDNILDVQNVMEIYQPSDVPKNKTNLETKTIFIPNIGRCQQITRYDPLKMITIEILGERRNDLDIFITDSHYSTNYNLDYDSHHGDPIRIHMESNEMYSYNIEINQDDTRNPYKESNCKDATDNEYEACVDGNLWEYVQRNMSCNPPWLSSHHQCNESFRNISVYQFLADDFQEKIVEVLFEYRKNFAEEKCKRPCVVMTNHARLKGRGATKFGISGAYLEFSPKVTMKSKVKAYDTFQFIIDVGSSLGLWIGLSALGLMEFVLMYMYKFQDVVQSQKSHQFP